MCRGAGVTIVASESQLNENTSKHAKMGGEKPTKLQPHKELKETGGRRDGPSQERAHQLGVHCQTVSPAKHTYSWEWWCTSLIPALGSRGR